MNRCSCGRACRKKECYECKRARLGDDRRFVPFYLKHATDAELLDELDRRGLHPDSTPTQPIKPVTREEVLRCFPASLQEAVSKFLAP